MIWSVGLESGILRCGRSCRFDVFACKQYTNLPPRSGLTVSLSKALREFRTNRWYRHAYVTSVKILRHEMPYWYRAVSITAIGLVRITLFIIRTTWHLYCTLLHLLDSARNHSLWDSMEIMSACARYRILQVLEGSSGASHTGPKPRSIYKH